ncbi:SDR family NAD(P)-dependent oxidoreductase [Flavobacterium sp. IMCC34518]|uniref:SDR family NAD(P)-dependent oxidoreductase n=1 Tax=Flavobacterium sp. IMCC34518 TaxID=3003623 RepID=UPI0022AC1ADA|nr:SDR family NAD(P)-dependent oxidoreductase [Flavobacterium sp. IMCC34518]
MKKLITIIGAGPGISQGVADKFGKENFKIALISRTESKLQEQVMDLAKNGIDATYAVADVANQDSLKSALLSIKEKEGHAEVILYNAVAFSGMDILDQKWETIREQMDVNVGGYFNLMKMVLPFCIKENKGNLFVTNGGFALSGDDQLTSLSVGKAALRNLVQAFQKKATGTNVHIAQLTVCGFVNPNDEKYSPKAIAEQYWKLYLQNIEQFELEIIY